MRIGLIDVDSHNYPNLALMKLSAYHKSIGDEVEWWNGFMHYDIVYKSKVFDDTYTKELPWVINADKIISGGTGYDLENKLPDHIEHIMPDYSLYGITNKSYGFLTRGCPRGCHFCIVEKKEGRRSVKVADLSEWWSGQKNIVLMDPNLLAYKGHMELLDQLAKSKAWIDVNQGFDCRLLTEDNIGAMNRLKFKEIHFAWDYMKEEKAVLRGLELYTRLAKRKPHGQFGTVYVLVNYDTTMEENLYRIYTLRDMGYDPYVMVYNKPIAPDEILDLQRWCNNRLIFKKCRNFRDYRRNT